ncbi:hypothetical protein E2C01_013662 [Portunus trituberculatus]|uniref:Uncharacterized protein n=1 Tax=Portunus trituberculatus TaxID=210409 RepID=A0A5B7DHS3_PORTR|nr:hypothetical protein [Portunus trituberculatus]
MESAVSWGHTGMAEDGSTALIAGFDEVDDDDVQDLLESHTEPLSNDEFIELDKASQEAEKEGDKCHGKPMPAIKFSQRSQQTMPAQGYVRLSSRWRNTNCLEKLVLEAERVILPADSTEMCNYILATI